MKLIAVVNPRGRVVGTARPTPKSHGVQAALIPAPGHTVHELEVPDDCEKLSAAELHERINSILLQSRTPPCQG